MLNKTLKASVRRIKSAPKYVLLLGLVVLIFITLVIASFVIKLVVRDTGQAQVEKPNCLKIIDPQENSSFCDYNLEIAKTNSQRLKGLSDRDSMPLDTAMLFDFGGSSEQCMWMKDMKFSLDMIWLNERKEITKIEKNVTPESYPTAYCAPDTYYVLELNSGEVEKHNLSLGEALIF